MNDNHECKRERDFVRIMQEHDELAKKSDSYVTWTVFWSIIVLLVGIGGSSIGNTYSSLKELDNNHQKQFKDLEDRTRETEIVSTKIETQLAEIQKQLVDINLKLSKIK